MYMETLRGMAGIGIFPALSLLLFVVIFAVVLYRVARMKPFAGALLCGPAPRRRRSPAGEERENAHEQ